MAELKINDINSLNAVTDALNKNGYEYSTFIYWKRDGFEVDYFVVRIEGV